MSRFIEGDDDTEFAALDQGRWEHNARRVLKSQRGRKALAEIREALLALPEKRLISGALCTAGDVDALYPAITDAEFAAKVAELAASPNADAVGPGWPETVAACEREDRNRERREFMATVEQHGAGVCLIGAYLWHRKVAAGADPAEAFQALPSLFDGDENVGDPLWETAKIAEQEAGMARTLAWELAYRNDETYRRMTPEERYEAFLGWINAELGDAATVAA